MQTQQQALIITDHFGLSTQEQSSSPGTLASPDVAGERTRSDGNWDILGFAQTSP